MTKRKQLKYKSSQIELEYRKVINEMHCTNCEKTPERCTLAVGGCTCVPRIATPPWLWVHDAKTGGRTLFPVKVRSFLLMDKYRVISVVLGDHTSLDSILLEPTCRFGRPCYSKPYYKAEEIDIWLSSVSAAETAWTARLPVSEIRTLLSKYVAERFVREYIVAYLQFPSA